MKLLRIENRVDSFPPVEAIRLFGESTSRGLSSRIGQFGSGFIFSLALMAREGILPFFKLCIGRDVYTVHLKQVGNFVELVMKKQGGGTFGLNLSPGAGAVDWTDVTHVSREFISNAIDGADSAGLPGSSVVFEVVEENQARADSDTVRVYIALTPEIEDYFNNRLKYFPCLAEGYNSRQVFMPKKPEETTRIYRRGVLVRDTEKHGLYHYNFSDITVNECRVADTWTCEWYVAKAWKNAKKENVGKFLETMVSGKSVYEFGLNTENMVGDDNTEWKSAIDGVMGGRVLTDHKVLADRVESRGHVPLVAEDKFYKLLSKAGMTTAVQVLGEDQAAGREVVDAPSDCDLSLVLNLVWGDLEQGGFTQGKAKPALKLFHEPVDGGKQTHGFYRPGEDSVYMNKILQGMSPLAFQTVLEECGHYITGFADCTREFQDWAFSVAAYKMRGGIN